MEEYLKEKNKKFWKEFREILQQFNVENNDTLKRDEQEFVNLFSNQLVGNLASHLTEFYQNACAAPQDAGLEQLIDQKMQTFTNRVAKSIPLQIASERDLFELKLLDNGYSPKTSFNLATKSLYNGIYTNSAQMERALNETISKTYQHTAAAKSVPTFKQAEM